MDKAFWIGRFVRITNEFYPHIDERGQVVNLHQDALTVRYATGEHAVVGTGSVIMDADQQTPVWPPVVASVDAA